MDYLVSRAGWTADYPDAMTFVELFVKDGGNNSTGWSNARFDALIQGARLEMNPDARFANIAQAEQIVLEELPVLPIYHYTSPFMLDMRVGGFYENTLDLHPYKSIYIKSDAPNVTSPATAPGGKRE